MHRHRRLQLRQKLVVQHQVTERSRDVEQGPRDGKQRRPNGHLLHPPRGDDITGEPAGAAGGPSSSAPHSLQDRVDVPLGLVRGP